MKLVNVAVSTWLLSGLIAVHAHEQHSHPAPEKLGAVTFPTSCAPAVQSGFERGVALLHSFAYTAAEEAFRATAKADPKCAMAHWGVAMTYFHQLWDPPPGADDLRKGWAAINHARELGAGSAREKQFIEAMATYYRDSERLPHADRAKAYEQAMAEVAKSNPKDPEAQIFHALILIALAPAEDRTHANQKRAAEILEPLLPVMPQHPGLTHYLIHAYDSAELATRGVAAARTYASIAPSAPHALHMPSHIFTRLGLWEDSIASNQAAREAARAHGDVGEELHAMDYLTYAYLQRGRDADAARMVDELRAMREMNTAGFKVGYAATAIPVRLAVERQQWGAATAIQLSPQSPPHVAAIAYWARAIGHARSGHPQPASRELAELDARLQKLRAAGNEYWAMHTEVLSEEVQAWILHAEGRSDEAVRRMRSAADKEDAVEKRPVTPGPIVPAREQLGELLLELERPSDALREFQLALAEAPGRRGSLLGAVRAAELAGDVKAAERFRGELEGAVASAAR